MQLYVDDTRGFDVMAHPDESVFYTRGLSVLGWPELCAAEELAGNRADTVMRLADMAARVFDDPSLAPGSESQFQLHLFDQDIGLIDLNPVQASVMATVAEEVERHVGIKCVRFLAVEVIP